MIPILPFCQSSWWIDQNEKKIYAPTASMTLTAAHEDNSSRTTALCPFSEARCSGVRPSWDSAIQSRQRFESLQSTFFVLFCPPKLTPLFAQERKSTSSFELTFVWTARLDPACRRTCVTCTWPLSAARWSGVRRILSTHVTLAPWRSSSSTHRVDPLAAPQCIGVRWNYREHRERSFNIEKAINRLCVLSIMCTHTYAQTHSFLQRGTRKNEVLRMMTVLSILKDRISYIVDSIYYAALWNQKLSDLVMTVCDSEMQRRP